MENKLQVRDLRISFRTSNGKVQAVRGINFDLAKGETIAIVGESGSGKSVTSKAVLGILANNAIVESGEIIYDGKDLLKITEDEFHKIRGDKIAMIFQDPMSSLNPIVKIGRQLTEAMILKGKARQKESRRTFNSFLKRLEKNIIAAKDPSEAAGVKAKCKAFDKFERKHLKLEGKYNVAYDAATEALGEAEELVFELSHDAGRDVNYRVNRIADLSVDSIHEYVVNENAAELKQHVKLLRRSARTADADSSWIVNVFMTIICAIIRNTVSKEARLNALTRTAEILREAVGFEKPDFFAMGYFKTFCKEAMPEGTVAEQNAYMNKALYDGFMNDFLSIVDDGLRYSAEAAYDKKAEAMSVLAEQRRVFEEKPLNKKACMAAYKTMVDAVEAGIDRMEYVKDSRAYTFSSVLKNNIDRYFGGIEKNAAEEKRFAKQTARYEALVQKGKEPEWHVVPKSLIDLEKAQEDLLRAVDNMIAHYEELIARRTGRDYDKEAVAMVDYLKENASGVVNKVTKGIAKERAIKLMKEVGIADARKRYNQYPFEFSGGMRQRIVIAIALAANPDILICDEPTTALDVTIQAQILELIQKLKKDRNLSVIFITHDLGVVANMADRIAVMYAGKIVECGTSEEVFYSPAHPYTWALLSSMPDLDSKEKLEAIPGTPPDMIYPPVGDAFAERNRYAMKIDFEQQPPEFRITDTHWAATWLLHPDAPKVEPPKTVTNRIAKMKARMEAAENV